LTARDTRPQDATTPYAGPGHVQVVVLMGGLATRLGDAARTVPKALIDVEGRPFFAIVLDALKRRGLRRFLLLTGHLGDQVRAAFVDGAGLGVRIDYRDDGPEPLGTGGALRAALPLLDERFFLLYGDSYMDIDYERLYREHLHHEREGRAALMSLYRNDDALERSNARFEGGRLVRYDKRADPAGMRHVDFGVSVVRRDLVARIPANTPADLADLMRDATAEGLVAGCELRDRFWEIGRPGPLEAFRAYVRDRAARPRKAVFLDRDGTINEQVRGGAEGVDSPFRPEDVRLIPGAADALKRLKSLGYLLIVVTNQPGATKGKATVPDLWRVDDRVRDLLAAEGVAIDDSLVCPHHPAGVPDRCPGAGLIGPCACRKPAPGLIGTAAAKHGIDLAASFLVGDSDADIGAAEAAGVRAVRVGPNGGTLSEFADRLLQGEA